MMSCPMFARTIGRALLKALPQEAETSRSSQSGSRGRPAPRRRERGSGWPANPLPASGILGSAFCSLPSDFVLGQRSNMGSVPPPLLRSGSAWLGPTV